MIVTEPSDTDIACESSSSNGLVFAGSEQLGVGRKATDWFISASSPLISFIHPLRNLYHIEIISKRWICRYYTCIGKL